MSAMTVALADSISQAEARLCLAAKLFEVGRLCCGQAAQLAGYSERTFLELLGKQGIAVLKYPAEESADDPALLAWETGSRTPRL